jgi:hypothetical protein
MQRAVLAHDQPQRRRQVAHLAALGEHDGRSLV